MPRASIAFLAVLLYLAPTALAEDAPAVRETRDVVKDLKSRDRDLRLAAIGEAGDHQEPSVTTPLAKLAKDADGEIRLAALEALRGRTSESCRKTAAKAIALRLRYLTGRLEYEEEYHLAIVVLHDLAQTCSIPALLDMEVEEPLETARARFLAVGNVPHKSAIDELISFAAKGRARGRNKQREFAIQALSYATGQKLGNNLDRWRDWWRDVEKEWDCQLVADQREEEREKARQKAERQEEKRRQQEEKRREREEKRRQREREADPGQEA